MEIQEFSRGEGARALWEVGALVHVSGLEEKMLTIHDNPKRHWMHAVSERSVLCHGRVHRCCVSTEGLGC